MARGVSSTKFATRPRRVAAWLGAALICAAFAPPPSCAAQGRARGGGLPRVGTIRDYPATGLTVGCGNIYARLPRRPESAAGDDYVFISSPDGGNAWMNLGGRDVRLRRIGRAGPGARRFEYRAGGLRVSVAFEEVRPGDPLYDEDIMFRLRITLRRGRAARAVRAVGHADC